MSDEDEKRLAMRRQALVEALKPPTPEGENQADVGVDVEIGSEELHHFRIERWRTPECPVCGRDDWGMGAPGHVKGLLPNGRASYRSIMQTSSSLPVLWLACQTCGHVELIAWAVLAAWMRSRKSG